MRKREEVLRISQFRCALREPLLRRGEIRIERQGLFESENGALVLIEQKPGTSRDWSAFSYKQAKF